MMDQHYLKLDFLNSFGSNFVQKDVNLLQANENKNTKNVQKRQVMRSLLFLESFDQPQIIYPIGKHIGIRNIVTNSMRFLRQSDSVREITSLNISTNKRYLAVCEKRHGDNNAHISFYDIKNLNNVKFMKSTNMTDMVFGGKKHSHSAGDDSNKAKDGKSAEDE